jgi:hypothetical protein
MVRMTPIPASQTMTNKPINFNMKREMLISPA